MRNLKCGKFDCTAEAVGIFGVQDGEYTEDTPLCQSCADKGASICGNCNTQIRLTDLEEMVGLK